MIKPVPYAPVNITQLIPNNNYFFVLVYDKEMRLGDPFQFLGIGTEAPEDHHPPEKIIWRQRVPGFPNKVGADEFLASGMGLLVGTDYPMRYGDSHWRTFTYSKDVYKFFAKLVQEKNWTLYAEIVGPPVPLTPAQRTQRFILDARIEAIGNLYFRHAEDSD